MKTRGHGRSLANIDEQHYAFWQALYMSFYSARLYIDVLKRWRGFGVLYLLIAILLFTLPLSIKTILKVDQFFVHDIIHPIQTIPDISLDNGLVKFDKPMPWKINNARGNPEVIIDTTGAITQIDQNQYPDLRVLITENSLVVDFPFYDNFTRERAEAMYPSQHEIIFPPDASGTLTSDMIMDESGIQILRWFAAIAIWPMFVFAFYGVYLMVVFSFAIMGQVVASAIFRFPLGYRESVRLMMVAITPHLALAMFTLTTDRMAPLSSMLALALIAVYFSYAVLANKRVGRKLVRQ